MSQRAGMPRGERAKELGAGVLWLLALGVVVAFLMFPVATGVRRLSVPLIGSIGSGSPSAVALLTLSLYVVPTIVLTALIALRIRGRVGRAATWRRIALAVLVLVPGLSLTPPGRGGSLYTARINREIAEYMGAKELADAVIHGYSWGRGGLLLWGVLGLVCLYLTAWRRLKNARLLTYVVVTGGGMVAYWAVVLSVTAVAPLDALWSGHPWGG